jgi:phosphotransacetylase
MEHKREKYQRLLDSCKSLPPTPTAVVHPCDESSLRSVVDAAHLGLIAPLLVGPRARIEAVAKRYKIALGGLPIVDAPYSEASAAKAVELVRVGRAEALMKGSLHTDELMGTVVARESGLRTGRRISHCFVMDIPSYAETVIVTDAAINIAPTMEDKVHIIQNAIDVAHALHFPEVRVTILSAIETINTRLPSTVEAGALCKMADRGQITGATLDGPPRCSWNVEATLRPSRAARRRACTPRRAAPGAMLEFAGGGAGSIENLSSRLDGIYWKKAGTLMPEDRTLSLRCSLAPVHGVSWIRSDSRAVRTRKRGAVPPRSGG